MLIALTHKLSKWCCSKNRLVSIALTHKLSKLQIFNEVDAVVYVEPDEVCFDHTHARTHAHTHTHTHTHTYTHTYTGADDSFMSTVLLSRRAATLPVGSARALGWLRYAARTHARTHLYLGG